MTQVTRVLGSSTFKSSLLLGNGLWHLAALHAFTQKPRGILRKYTHPSTPHTPSTHDVLIFLGALNSSLSFLAFYRLYRTLKARKRALTTALSKGKGKEWGEKQEKQNGLQAAVEAQVERSEDRLAFLTLGVANGSQALLDLFSQRLFDGRWRLGGFDIITVLDTFFLVADWLWAYTYT
ncbi:hypothetical protein BCR35DRAFT_354699 [Leucosporidium creatinivorum]|uniref:Peroxisomal biogenesis factor 11 n=1 Tax=Leucosporidium creatinivorum TaxID=106004 RepID=A0A1Y2EC53_9BASI|nr:hypothetical protein BCR35DRAFT_354699 [Leucosporidium creatinivorum]